MIKDSFGSLKDKANLKYAAALVIAIVIYFAVYFGIYFGILIFAPYLAIILPVFDIIFQIILYAIIVILTIKITLRALKSFGMKAATFSIGQVLSVLVYWFVLVIALNLLFLIFLIPAGIVFGILWLLNIDILINILITVLVALLLMLIYFIVLIYFGIRLSLFVPALLSKDQGFVDGLIGSIKESWKITKGNVIKILIAELLLTIVFFALIMAVSMILTGILLVLALIVGIIVAMLSLDLGTLMLILVAGYILFFLIIFIVFMPVNALMFVIQTYFQVAIYKSVLGITPTKTTAQKPKTQITQQKPKPATAKPKSSRMSKPTLQGRTGPMSPKVEGTSIKDLDL